MIKLLKTLIVLITFILFITGYEQFWRLFGISFITLELVAGFSCIFILVHATKSDKSFRSSPKNNFYLEFTLFYCFCFCGFYIHDIKRLDITIYVLVTQFILVITNLLLLTKYKQYKFQFFSNRLFLFVNIINIVIVYVIFTFHHFLFKKHAIFNENWVLISSILIILLTAISNDKVSKLESKLIVFLFALFPVIIKSQSIGNLFSVITLILFLLSGKKYLYVFICLFILSLLFFLVPIFTNFSFYEINYYVLQNVNLKFDRTKDLSSGRFVVWDFVIDYLQTNYKYLFLGVGLGEQSNFIINQNEHQTLAVSHNFLIETIYRVGIFGLFLFLLPYFKMLWISLCNSTNNTEKKMFFLLSTYWISTSHFYDLGGFTHLPGGYVLKVLFVICFLKHQISSNSNISNPDTLILKKRS